MKKKVLLITMCLVMTIVCLCGCSSDTEKSYNNSLYDDVFVYVINYVGKEVEPWDMTYNDFGYTIQDCRKDKGIVIFSDPKLNNYVEYYVVVGYDGHCVEGVMLCRADGTGVFYSEIQNCPVYSIMINGKESYWVDNLSDLTVFVQDNLAYPISIY